MHRCALLLLLAGGLAGAAVVRVTPADDVQRAVDAAQPGDTVRLAPGIYHRRLVLSTSGLPGKPITVEGEPGAILDGSEPFTPEWQPAPDVAPGVYRAKVPFMPFTVVADGKIVTTLDEKRTRPTAETNENWRWPHLMQVGVLPSGWTGVKALAIYLSGPKELLIRFQGDLDPRTMTFALGRRLACVHVSGADRVVVRGLAMRNCGFGVLVEDSLGAVVERCTIGPADYGVWLGGGTQQATVRFNELFMNPYAGADPRQPGAWDNWLAHKVGGFYDRYGIQIRQTVGGHRIHDNDIHDTWDGIEDVGGIGENVGLRIHHNRIHTISDDGLEPNGGEEDCEWHDNVVEHCICGFRIKAPEKGPLYAYRNIFFANGEDYRNYGEVELKPAVVYVYHNTSTSGAAITSNKVTGIGNPQYHYLNNLFHCRAWWSNSASVEPNWQGDYNVYAQSSPDRRWEQGIALAKKLGLDAHSLFTAGEPGFCDLEHHDVALKADSVARGRGADLAQLVGRPLPGLPAGAHPDCGALQFGEPMPRLPRAPEAVDAPAAGTWPGPEAQRIDPWQGLNLLADGGFEQGFTGWLAPTPKLHELLTDGAAEGGHYLVITAGEQKADLQQTVHGLTPGQGYVLVYRSRRNTIDDFRVIVRNLANGGYLAQGSASPGAAWRRTTLKFTAPAPDVRLELSPRTPGHVDLDDLGVYAAK